MQIVKVLAEFITILFTPCTGVSGSENVRAVSCASGDRLQKRARATAHGEYVVYQIRIHGRGGQGVVTAAEMLSVAAFTEGHWAQAFPSFGSERTGAPVVAFARIDEKEIRLREPIQEPDVVLVQDRTLLESEDEVGS